MRLQRLLFLLPLALLVVLPAKADQVWVDGSTSSFTPSGYGIGPYGGTLNNTPAQFFCVDFNSQIFANTGWTATVTNLSGGSFGQTYQGNQTFYLEAAWLINQMMKSPNNQALDTQLQFAIWYLSLTSAQRAGIVGLTFPDRAGDIALDTAALNAVESNNLGFSLAGWEILTPVGGGSGYGQEFMIFNPAAATPEPRTIVLLFAGLAAFLIFAHKK